MTQYANTDVWQYADGMHVLTNIKTLLFKLAVYSVVCADTSTTFRAWISNYIGELNGMWLVIHAVTPKAV